MRHIAFYSVFIIIYLFIDFFNLLLDQTFFDIFKLFIVRTLSYFNIKIFTIKRLLLAIITFTLISNYSIFYTVITKYTFLVTAN